MVKYDRFMALCLTFLWINLVTRSIMKLSIKKVRTLQVRNN